MTRGSVTSIALPALLVCALLAAWQVAASSGVLADVLGLDSFLVPSPSEILTSLRGDSSLLAENAWVTFKEVLAGFAAALALGVGTAAVLHLSPLLRRISYPVVVASQTIPVIVIAPILVVWFGFGIGPKIAIIALICFFPIAVNTLDGLGTTQPDQRKLLQSLGAGRLRVFTMLEAPTALPFMFSGAKIAAAVAVIGAVFGEWAGATEGLGHLMLIDNARLEVARLFAAMFWLSAMAIVLFAILSLIEHRVAWWVEPRRPSDGAGKP